MPKEKELKIILADEVEKENKRVVEGVKVATLNKLLSTAKTIDRDILADILAEEVSEQFTQEPDKSWNWGKLADKIMEYISGGER